MLYSVFLLVLITGLVGLFVCLVGCFGKKEISVDNSSSATAASWLKNGFSLAGSIHHPPSLALSTRYQDRFRVSNMDSDSDNIVFELELV